jgi:hypothetical protein
MWMTNRSALLLLGNASLSSKGSTDRNPLTRILQFCMSTDVLSRGDACVARWQQDLQAVRAATPILAPSSPWKGPIRPCVPYNVTQRFDSENLIQASKRGPSHVVKHSCNDARTPQRCQIYLTVVGVAVCDGSGQLCTLSREPQWLLCARDCVAVQR